MDAVPIRDARAQLSRLVARAEAGEEIVIRRRSIPVAKIVAYRAPKTPQRRPGALKGQITLGLTSTRYHRISPAIPRKSPKRSAAAEPTPPRDGARGDGSSARARQPGSAPAGRRAR